MKDLSLERCIAFGDSGGPSHEQVVAAELRRIESQNRDITISVNERIVMLRIPLTFELIPIERLHTADEIARLSGTQTAQGNGR